jgi:hypothetical protein
MVQVSPQRDVLWRYDLGNAGLRRIRRPRSSWDGSTIYFYGVHEDASEGIWAMPAQGGEPNLVIVNDDAETRGLVQLSVDPDHLYVTVEEHESDIWVMDVEVER